MIEGMGIFTGSTTQLTKCVTMSCISVPGLEPSCVLPKPITSNKKADLEAAKSCKPQIAQYVCTLTLPYLPCVRTIFVGIAYNSCRWWRHWLMHQIFSSSVVQLLWYWNCLCEIVLKELLFLACTGWRTICCTWNNEQLILEPGLLVHVVCTVTAIKVCQYKCH